MYMCFIVPSISWYLSGFLALLEDEGECGSPTLLLKLMRVALKGMLRCAVLC